MLRSVLDYAVSRDILIYRANQCPPPSQSLIHSFSAHLDSFSLPSVLELVSDLPSKKAWKALTKTLVFEEFRDIIESSTLPSLSHIVNLPPAIRYGHPALIIEKVKHNLSLSNLRIRLILHATICSCSCICSCIISMTQLPSPLILQFLTLRVASRLDRLLVFYALLTLQKIWGTLCSSVPHYSLFAIRGFLKFIRPLPLLH